eukprot:gene6154-11547_t
MASIINEGLLSNGVMNVLVSRDGSISDLKNEMQETLKRLFPHQIFCPINHLRKDKGKVILPDWYPVEPLLDDNEEVFVNYEPLNSECAAHSKRSAGSFQTQCSQTHCPFESDKQAQNHMLDKDALPSSIKHAADFANSLIPIVLPDINAGNDRKRKSKAEEDGLCEDLEDAKAATESQGVSDFKKQKANEETRENSEFNRPGSILDELISNKPPDSKSTQKGTEDTDPCSKICFDENSEQKKKKKKKKRKASTELAVESVEEVLSQTVCKANETSDMSDHPGKHLKDRKRQRREISNSETKQEIGKMDASEKHKEREEDGKAFSREGQKDVEPDMSEKRTDVESIAEGIKKKKGRKKRNSKEQLFSGSSVASSNLKESGIGSGSSPVEMTKHDKVLNAAEFPVCKGEETKDKDNSKSLLEINDTKNDDFESQEKKTNTLFANNKEQCVDKTTLADPSEVKEEVTVRSKKKRHRKEKQKVNDKVNQNNPPDSNQASFSICESGVPFADKSGAGKNENEKRSSEKENDACSEILPMLPNMTDIANETRPSKAKVSAHNAPIPALLTGAVAKDTKTTLNAKPTFDYETDAETHNIKAKIKEVVNELIEESDHSQSMIQGPLKFATKLASDSDVTKKATDTQVKNAYTLKKSRKSEVLEQGKIKVLTSAQPAKNVNLSASKRNEITEKSINKTPHKNHNSDDDDDDDRNKKRGDESSSSETSSITFSDYDSPQVTKKKNVTAKSPGKKLSATFSVKKEEDKHVDSSRGLFTPSADDKNEGKNGSKRRKSISASSTKKSVEKVNNWLSQISEGLSSDPETVDHVDEGQAAPEKREESFLVLETTVEKEEEGDKKKDIVTSLDKGKSDGGKVSQKYTQEEEKSEFKKPGIERRTSSRRQSKISHEREGISETDKNMASATPKEQAGARKKEEKSPKKTEDTGKSRDDAKDGAKGKSHSPVKDLKFEKKTKVEDNEDGDVHLNFDNLFEDASSVVSTKIKAPAKSQSVRKPLSGFLSSADRLRFKSKVQNTKHSGDKDASARLNKTIR